VKVKQTSIETIHAKKDEKKKQLEKEVYNQPPKRQ